MDTAKIKTLDQVSDAMDSVEEARCMPGLSTAERDALEQTSVALRDIERSIIKNVQDELVDQLKADSENLKELIENIEQVSKKLDGLTDTLEKTTKAVDGLITVIVTAVGAGLL